MGAVAAFHKLFERQRLFNLHHPELFICRSSRAAAYLKASPGGQQAATAPCAPAVVRRAARLPACNGTLTDRLAGSAAGSGVQGPAGGWQRHGRPCRPRAVQPAC